MLSLNFVKARTQWKRYFDSRCTTAFKLWLRSFRNWFCQVWEVNFTWDNYNRFIATFRLQPYKNCFRDFGPFSERLVNESGCSNTTPTTSYQHSLWMAIHTFCDILVCGLKMGMVFALYRGKFPTVTSHVWKLNF